MTNYLSNAQWPIAVPETRYGGNGIDWSIRRLADTDQMALMRGYQAVLKLLDASFDPPTSDIATIEKIADWMLRADWQSLRRDLAAVGPDTYAEFGTSPVLRKVLHDLRGGPMTSLAIDLGFIRAGRKTDVDPHRVFLLARDVCKIMRNSFPDLDPERYSADSEIKTHSVDLLVEKWERIQHDHPIVIHSDFSGSIAETCIEFSALDRVLYNVVNNALRETAPNGEPIRIQIAQESTPPHRHARFVISNTLTDDQEAHLLRRFGEEPSDLFTEDFSTTGSGIGLKVVSDFVSRTYDTTVRRAIKAGILGIELHQKTFYLWFHWPRVDSAT